MNVWALLEDAIAGPGPRPENSVTPQEFSERTGYSREHSRSMLEALVKGAKLRRVEYREGPRRGICYVPTV